MHTRDRVLWLRSFLQPVTYLGLGLGAFIVAGLVYLTHKDQEEAYNAAARTGANLAQVFEGYMSRTIKSVDNTLRVLRTSYQQDPANFDLQAWARNLDVQNELTLQITIVGADGLVRSSTSGERLIGRYFGDREHFQVQVHADSDEVFIGKPVVLQVRGQFAIVLSRRITAPDGSFAGIVSAVMDPQQLRKFYDAIDLGKEVTASLVGFDGVIRARGGGKVEFRDKIGTRLAGAGVMSRYQQAPTGVYWNVGGTIDAVRRLVTYRVIEGYPLIALVGLGRNDIYQHANQNARIYYSISCALMLVIAAAIGLGAVRERKLLLVTSSLGKTNAWFNSALQNLPLGLCLYDNDHRLITCNDRYGKMYGLSSEKTKPGTSIGDVLAARAEAGSIPAGDRNYVARGLEMAKHPVSGYFVEHHTDGRYFNIGLGLLPGGGWVAVHQDITAQKHAEAEITHLAHYDGLTALANRVLFLQHVNTASARCRTENIAFAVHILDLDRFKEVNDTLGHACGDQLLRIVAQRLLNVVGEGDMVARLGGDEFAIFQPIDPARGITAESLADKVLCVFADPFDLNEHRINVETSMGIALAPDNGDVAEQLLKTADLALYKAKSEGRNTYRLFKNEMEIEARARHAMQVDLRHAIGAEQFELHYQPIVDAKSQEPCGVEALVPWRHPVHGLVPPDKFIPLAEETGLIVPLGEWVLRTACRDAAAWPDHLKVAVNLSSVQFRKSNLKQVVDAALADSGLPAKRLELEVTESVLLQNNEENTDLLHQFRAKGISIALDDFGTGYSSLSYLQSFPFDKIKIDRSFIANLSSRADCAAIVSAVTGLARSLDIQTTAEGVETEEQVTLLRAAGCGQMQGYLFGRPRPKSELDFTKATAKNAVA